MNRQTDRKIDRWIDRSSPSDGAYGIDLLCGLRKALIARSGGLEYGHHLTYDHRWW